MSEQNEDQSGQNRMSKVDEVEQRHTVQIMEGCIGKEFGPSLIKKMTFSKG